MKWLLYFAGIGAAGIHFNLFAAGLTNGFTAVPASAAATKTVTRELVSTRVLNRTEHTKELESVQRMTDSVGVATLKTNRYKVLSPGMYRTNEAGELVESRPVLEIAADGSVVGTGANYTVRLAADLATRGAVTVDRGAEHFVAQLLGVNWFDPDSQRSAIAGVVQSSRAEIVPAVTNAAGDITQAPRVVFRNALAGVKASVLFQYRAGGFSQWVVVEENITPPPGFGPHSRLEAMSEIVESPPLTREAHVLRPSTNGVTRAPTTPRAEEVVDEQIKVGAKTILAPGAAFLTANGTNGSGKRIPVSKRIWDTGSRRVLIEGVEFQAAQGELQKLPRRTASTEGASRAPTLGRELPTPLWADASAPKRPAVMLAQAELPAGLVTDWDLEPELEDFEFTPGTWVATEWVNVMGATFYSGACIKATAGAGITVMNYLYGGSGVTFTSFDDNSVGGVTGSGNPSRSGAPALLLYWLYGQSLTGLDIRWAGTGIAIYGGNYYTTTIGHTDIQQCDVGVYVYDCTVALDTVDFCNVDTPTSAGNYGWISTVNQTQCHNPDSDGDGLNDAWEYLYFGPGNLSHTAIEDYDQDGRNNGEEQSESTNPTDPNSAQAVRLGRWRFNGTLANDDGYSPVLSGGVGSSLVPGLEGQALDMAGPPYTKLIRYRESETDGHVNITLRRGTVRFWFKPNWSSASRGGTGPEQFSPVIGFGWWDTTVGSWSLGFDPSGDGFNIGAMDDNGQWHTAGMGWTTIPGGVQAGQWRQITVTYSPTSAAFYLDGVLVRTGPGLGGLVPVGWVRNWGWALGTDIWGAEGTQSTFDLLETYNYELTAGAVLSAYQADRPDTDSDGLPDDWEIAHFGDLSQTAGGDYDGDQVLNGAECTARTDPNTIGFKVSFPSQYVGTSPVAGTLTVAGGWPAHWLVRVDQAPDSAPSPNQWPSCPSGLHADGTLAVTADLGPMEGEHTVWVGMAGRAGTSKPTWASFKFKLDHTPPVLHLTSPSVSVLPYPVAQVKGYSDEPLVKLRYDVHVGGVPIILDAPAFVTARRGERSDFQAFDVKLQSGDNTITLHAWDRAGNEATNTIPLEVNIPTQGVAVGAVTWPAADTKVCANSFTVTGTVADPTSWILATIADSQGQTTTKYGWTDRDGNFYVENLPMGSGQNTLTVTITDAGNRPFTTERTLDRAVYTVGASLGSLCRLETTISGEITKRPNPGEPDPPNISTVTLNGQTIDVSQAQGWSSIQMPVDKDKSCVLLHVVLDGTAGEWIGTFEKPPFVRIGTYRESYVAGYSSAANTVNHTYALSDWQDAVASTTQDTGNTYPPAQLVTTEFQFPADRFLNDDPWQSDTFIAGHWTRTDLPFFVHTPSKDVHYVNNTQDPGHLISFAIAGSYRDINLAWPEADRAEWFAQDVQSTLILETGGHPGEWIPMQLDLKLKTTPGAFHWWNWWKEQTWNPEYQGGLPCHSESAAPGGVSLGSLGKTDSAGRVWVMVPAGAHIEVGPEFDGATLDRITSVHPTSGTPFQWADFQVTPSTPFDVTVDSDNNGTIEPDGLDDKLEHQIPGQIILVNQGDEDGDGLPNWADFQVDDPEKAFGNTYEMQVRVPSGGDSFRLKFTYDGSDPNAVDPNANPMVPPPGKIRIWRLCTPPVRSLVSDYVEPGREYSLAQLGMADPNAGGILSLEVEAVRPSTSAGDIDVKVELDPDAGGPMGYVQVDEVRLTAIGMALARVNPNNTTTKTTELEVSHPSPVVALSQCQIGAIYSPGPAYQRIQGTLVLSGSVSSSVCDLTSGDDGKIDEVQVYVNDHDTPVAVMTVTGTKGYNPGSILKPYEFTGQFTGTIATDVFDYGINLVRVTAVDKVYGIKGCVEYEVEVTGQPPVVAMAAAAAATGGEGGSSEPQGEWMSYEGWTFTGGTGTQVRATTGEPFKPYVVELEGPNEALDQVESINFGGIERVVYKLADKRYLATVADDKVCAVLLAVAGNNSAAQIKVIEQVQYTVGFNIGFVEGGCQLVGDLGTLAIQCDPIYVGWRLVTGKLLTETWQRNVESYKTIKELQDFWTAWHNAQLDDIYAGDPSFDQLDAALFQVSEDMRVLAEISKSLIIKLEEKLDEPDPFKRGKIHGRIAFEVVSVLIPEVKLGQAAKVSKVKKISLLEKIKLSLNGKNIPKVDKAILAADEAIAFERLFARTGKYDELVTRSARFQKNHLNQARAFEPPPGPPGSIPRNQGMCVEIEGSTGEKGSAHWKFHRSLEDEFWQPYRTAGNPKFNTTPTCSEYSEAMANSLRKVGYPEEEVLDLVGKARQNRIEFGLTDSMFVPRVPGRHPFLPE